MGFTHYFQWKQEPNPVQVKDCVARMAQLCDAQAIVPLAGWDGTGEPEYAEDHVSLNGCTAVLDEWGQEGDHETFLFPGATPEHPFDWQSNHLDKFKGYNFCKTARKPYDVVVTACLLLARDYFPADVLHIASDGDWGEESWTAGARLYRDFTGKDAACPFDEEEQAAPA